MNIVIYDQQLRSIEAGKTCRKLFAEASAILGMWGCGKKKLIARAWRWSFLSLECPPHPRPRRRSDTTPILGGISLLFRPLTNSKTVRGHAIIKVSLLRLSYLSLPTFSPPASRANCVTLVSLGSGKRSVRIADL